ncbi:MAG: PD40 domain-containing protein [Anaerolineae bacterium]|nr:PD40 domain-containing protein [Anaerolineae bacterium]
MNSKTRFYLIVIIFLAFIFTFIHFNFATVQATPTRGGSAIVRASVGVDMTQANDDSKYAAISGNGRYVTFNSIATNLVPNDTNGKQDVFVYDRQTGQTARVSVATDGTQGNGDSGEAAAPPAISEDGRYVAFYSRATNLMDDFPIGPGIYLHDRDPDENGVFDEPGMIQTIRIFQSFIVITTSNVMNVALSGNGRYIALRTQFQILSEDTDHDFDVYVHDRDADGNGIFDEMDGTEKRLVSIASDGTIGNDESGSVNIALSADGRFVAFDSKATNLVAGDTNNNDDIFLHDRDVDENGIFDEAGAVLTIRVSVASDGAQANEDSSQTAVSDDGRFITFSSLASNLGNQTQPEFCLSPGCRDIFVRDRDTDEDGVFDEPGQVATLLVSLNASSVQGQGHSHFPDISADGRYIAYYSSANNLVADDTNNVDDIFMYDTENGQTERISLTHLSSQSNSGTFLPSLSDDGNFISFFATASNLVDGDTNGKRDVFVVDRTAIVPPPPAATPTPLPANTPIPPTPGQDWQIQTLDVRGRAGEYSDIVIDQTTGTPHLAYYAAEGLYGKLKYSYWDGVAWHTEIIDAEGDSGQYASIALDPNNRPRIAYYDGANNQLKHAAWDGTNWSIEEITTGAAGTNAGWFASLAVDFFGVSHIAYYDVLNGNLLHSKRTFNGWDLSVVDDSADVGWGISMAISPQDGQPRIAYYDRDNGNLKYASYTADPPGWTAVPLDGLGDLGQYPALTFDFTGNVHISYYDATLDALKHATYNGTSWDYEYVNVNGAGGRHTDIFVDGTNTPSISYQSDVGLMLASSFGGSWTIETVDPTDNVGLYSSLAINSNLQEHIVYFDDDYQDLKYATWDGRWQHHPVETETDNLRPSLALHKTFPTFSTQQENDSSLHIRKWDGSNWTETLDTAIGSSSYDNNLVMDSSGLPRTVYFNELSGMLRYGQWNGSSWNWQNVTNLLDVNVGENIILLLDEADTPTIVFHQWDASENQLQIARQNGSNWQFAARTVGQNPGDIGHISAGLMQNGEVAISYYDQVAGELHSAIWNEAQWLLSLIDDGGSADVGQFNSLAVGKEIGANGIRDVITIAYYDVTNQSIKFAHNRSGDWFAQTVLPFVGNQINSLDLWLAEEVWTRPVLAYSAAGTALHVAYTDDLTEPWIVQFVTSGGIAPIEGVDMVHDGRFRLLYRDQNGGLNYTFPTAGTFNPVPAHVVTAGPVVGHVVGFDPNASCLDFAPGRQANLVALGEGPLADTAVMQGLTSLFGQTDAGVQYIYLYFEHIAEMADIGFADPILIWDSYRTLNNLMPGLEALVIGRGHEVMITQEMMDNALDIWQRLAAAGSPALANAINNELEQYHDLQDFVGMSFEDWAIAIGVAPPRNDVYLPFISK